jgi:hypothetical protein
LSKASISEIEHRNFIRKVNDERSIDLSFIRGNLEAANEGYCGVFLDYENKATYERIAFVEITFTGNGSAEVTLFPARAEYNLRSPEAHWLKKMFFEKQTFEINEDNMFAQLNSMADFLIVEMTKARF